MIPSELERSDDLWYEDGTLVLQAEETLFKVHRSILARHSGFFKDMLQLGNDLDGEGTENCPLYVPEVRGMALAALLRIVYEPAGTPLAMTTDTLVDVLRTAHRLQFDRAFSIAATNIMTHKDLLPLRKLGLALACSPQLDAWFMPAFQAVVLGFAPLTDPDNMLDDTTKLRILAARDRVTAVRLDFVFRLRGDIMTEHPSAGRSLSPAERYALVARTIPHTARLAFSNKALELRTATAPHQTCIGKELVDLNQQYLERWAPPHDYELTIVSQVWDSFTSKRTNAT